jgi:hypothetical protein
MFGAAGGAVGGAGVGAGVLYDTNRELGHHRYFFNINNY